MQIMLNIRKWSMERPHRVQRHLSADADTKNSNFPTKKNKQKIWKRNLEKKKMNDGEEI